MKFFDDFMKYGREREIRTPGGITLTGFQDRHIRPL